MSKKELGPMGPLGALRRLEVDPETYHELDTNLRTAASVAGAAKRSIPPHLALRLEGAIARCRGAVGKFTVTQRPPMWDADLLKVEELVRRLDVALVGVMETQWPNDRLVLEGLHQEAVRFLRRAETADDRKAVRVSFASPSGFHYEAHPLPPIREEDVSRGYRI